MQQRGFVVRAVMTAAVLVNFDLGKHKDHPIYLITLLVPAANVIAEFKATLFGTGKNKYTKYKF